MSTFNNAEHFYLIEEIKRVWSTFNAAETVNHLMRKYQIGKSLAADAVIYYAVNYCI